MAAVWRAADFAAVAAPLEHGMAAALPRTVPSQRLAICFLQCANRSEIVGDGSNIPELSYAWEKTSFYRKRAIRSIRKLRGFVSEISPQGGRKSRADMIAEPAASRLAEILGCRASFAHSNFDGWGWLAKRRSGQPRILGLFCVGRNWLQAIIRSCCNFFGRVAA